MSRRWFTAMAAAVAGLVAAMTVTASANAGHEPRVPAGFTEQRAAHLRASLEWFRTFPADIDDDAVYGRTELSMPVYAVGASGSLGDTVGERVKLYATDMTTATIADSGHQISEEHRAEMTAKLLNFLR